MTPHFWRSPDRKPFGAGGRLDRRGYAGFLVHLAFACTAIGIAGSALGSREADFSMARGETVEWAGWTVRYADLLQQDRGQNVAVAAELEVHEAAGASYTLRPARVLYRPQNQWGTSVAIHSTFRGDFYVIMHGGSAGKQIHLTLIDHPLMCWLWIGGWIGLAGVVVALWPKKAGVPALAGVRGRVQPENVRKAA